MSMENSASRDVRESVDTNDGAETPAECPCGGLYVRDYVPGGPFKCLECKKPMPEQRTVATKDELLHATDLRMIAAAGGAFDYAPSLLSAALVIERQADEIERLRAGNELLRESVSHLRCKHCGDNDFEPGSPAGQCAECDLWR